MLLVFITSIFPKRKLRLKEKQKVCDVFMFKPYTEVRVCIINHYFIGMSLNKHFMYIILLNLNNAMK